MYSSILLVKNLATIRSENFTLKISEILMEKNIIMGLIGNNGAGKTTLFLSCLGLLENAEGDVKFFNKSFGVSDSQDVAIKKNLGIFIDETYMINYMTVVEYFEFLRKIFEVPEDIYEMRLKEYLLIFHIDIDDNILIRNLSTGNRVKVGLMGTLLHNPALVMWDEPFANLDPLSRINLIKLVNFIRDKNQTSFFISSHNIDELYDFCDKFICLEDGIIKVAGNRKEISKEEIYKTLGAEKHRIN